MARAAGAPPWVSTVAASSRDGPGASSKPTRSSRLLTDPGSTGTPSTSAKPTAGLPWDSARSSDTATQPVLVGEGSGTSKRAPALVVTGFTTR